ncbi:MAG: hypothetical protein Q8O38_09955 [Sulfurimicrobium sp.]|nr:hypothetical protein [Sulfurimicrobium sp.]
MGGRGSGRFGERGGRPTTGDALRVTIGELLLGRLMRNIGVLFLTDDRVLINFFGCRTVEAGLTTTRHRNGGPRRWFACPRCDRRCAVLYLRGGALACRQCHGLVYASQRESYASRKLRVQILREWQAYRSSG